MLFLFFKVAKIIQKPNQYVRGVGKKGYLFSVVCDNVFFVCDDSMSTCFLFINSVLFCCKLSGLVRGDAYDRMEGFREERKKRKM